MYRVNGQKRYSEIAWQTTANTRTYSVCEVDKSREERTRKASAK